MLLALLACNGDAPLDPWDTQAVVTYEEDTSPPTDVDPETGDSAPDTETEDTDVEKVSSALVFRNARPENVVLLTVDTLRRDRIGAFGYDGDVTPTIDTILTEGVALTEHSSCSSWTYPSMLCALTGADQSTTGFFPANNDGAPEAAPDELTLMAERFEAVGYHTMLAGGTGFLGDSANMKQGYAAGSSAFEYDVYPDGRPAQEVLTLAKGLLASRPKDQPFFLHVHMLDPHMPYDPYDPAYLKGIEELDETTYDLSTEAGTLSLWAQFEGLSETAQAVNLEHLAFRYDADIRYTDDRIGELLAWMEEEDLWEDTLLVFHVDHGEEFWEHGNFNHGYTAYEEVVRTVGAFYQPGQLEPATVDTPTTHQDLLPTIAAVVGLEPDPDWTGLVVGQEERSDLFHLTWRVDQTVQSWTDGNAKLVYRWDGVEEFYELNSDADEQENLYDPKSAKVQAAWAHLLPEVNRLASQTEDASPVGAGL